jgi:hypothetical protein
MTGLSITLCFGSYGGFYIRRWRICLGWVALTAYPCKSLFEFRKPEETNGRK